MTAHAPATVNWNSTLVIRGGTVVTNVSVFNRLLCSLFIDSSLILDFVFYMDDIHYSYCSFFFSFFLLKYNKPIMFIVTCICVLFIWVCLLFWGVFFFLVVVVLGFLFFLVLFFKPYRMSRDVNFI